jgi:hypothetical protein
MSDYRELLLGCGHSRVKRVIVDPAHDDWSNLTTVDYMRACKPDVIADLRYKDWAIMFPGRWSDADQYDEIHAYEVLEHLGFQGSIIDFFASFYNCWRLLKPGGYLAATVPCLTSSWLWGDPGHTRVVSKESLIFLSRDAYGQLGMTSMSDYRADWDGDFETVRADIVGDTLIFVLRAIKPTRAYSL